MEDGIKHLLIWMLCSYINRILTGCFARYMIIKGNKYALFRSINIVFMKASLVFLIVVKSENFI